MHKKVVALLSAGALLLGTTACGGRPSGTSAGGQESKPKTAKHLPSLPDGLSGECSGDTSAPNGGNLPKVSLTTSDGNLNVEIPNIEDQMFADVGYYINFYDSGHEDHWTQVRIEYNHQSNEHTVSVVDQSNGAEQTNYGSWDMEPGNLLRLSVPTEHIIGSHGVKWKAAWDENGKDMASCPADGSMTDMQ